MYVLHVEYTQINLYIYLKNACLCVCLIVFDSRTVYPIKLKLSHVACSKRKELYEYFTGIIYTFLWGFTSFYKEILNWCTVQKKIAKVKIWNYAVFLTPILRWVTSMEMKQQSCLSHRDPWPFHRVKLRIDFWIFFTWGDQFLFLREKKTYKTPIKL